MSIAFALISFSVQGQDSYALNQRLSEAKNAGEWVEVLLDFHEQTLETNPDSALFICASALKEARQSTDSLDLAKTYSAFNENHHALGNNQLALLYIDSCRRHLPVGPESDELLAKTYSDESIVNDMLGDYPAALKASLAGLEIYQALKDSIGEGYSYNDIGVLYYYQDNDSLARIYYQRSFDIFEALEDTSGMALYYNNVANIMSDNGNHREAIEWYEKGLEFDIFMGDVDGQSITLSNIGETYTVLEDYVEAEKTLLASLRLAEESENYWTMSNPLRGLGDLYRRQGRLDKAIEMLERSVEIARDINALAELAEAHELLYEFHKEQGNFAAAMANLEAYKEASDSLYNRDKAQKMNEMEIIFRTKDNARQLALAEQLHEQEIAYQNKKSLWLWIGLGIFLILIIIISRSFLKSRKDARTLEEQKVTIEHKNVAVQQALDQIEEKNKAIVDSIRYAQSLQETILPTKGMIDAHFSGSSIFYLPKSIVAGDFYWLEEVDNHIFFAVADCTGHGVPGAMVSVVCSNALNKAVIELALRDPAEILQKTSEMVEEQFNKSDREVKDGMDISFCAFNKETNELQWAGANNPLLVIRNGELTEYKGDRRPVGWSRKPKPFNSHSIPIQSGDLLYMYTDGFPDQFGGEKGKKYRSGNFKKLLLRLSGQPLNAHADGLQTELETWRGDLEQIDDICVVGLQV